MDASDGSTIWIIDFGASSCFAVAIGPDGKRGYSSESAGDDEVNALDMADGSRVWAFTGTDDTVRGLDADSNWVYSAEVGATGESGVVRRIAASDGTLDWAYVGFQGFDDAFDCALAPDGTTVYAVGQGSDGPSTHAIDAATGAAIWTSNEPPSGRAIAVEPNGAWLVGAGAGFGNIKRLDSVDGSVVWAYDTSAHSALSVAISPDGSVVYGGDSDGITHALDASDGSVIWTISNPSGFAADINAVTVLPDDSLVVIGDGNGNVFGLDPADGASQWTREQSSTIHALDSFVSAITPPLRFEQRDDWEFANDPTSPRVTTGGQVPTTRQNSIRHSGQTYW